MLTNTGTNLLKPGKNPKANLQFLTFFVNTIKAVNDHADLLRAGIASAGNDHRLGANEAPPAIISVFIGEQLTNTLKELENVTDGKLSPEEKTDLKLNVVGKDIKFPIPIKSDLIIFNNFKSEFLKNVKKIENKIYAQIQ